ncbi:putative RNA methyltransferase [uncultured Umboniibacter sp.]|uniref:putative RNA methyltransferase n=1 Tax=uncultured Umboniibacter sp. TaxID=1798917 RepID=UPI0026189ECA|nr:methyltransferase domain-containing protein [uncultured Umboniibacter sp.]
MARFRCPICQQALQVDTTPVHCANGHCFDRAKQGYLNLLPVQNKRSKNPGDSKEMVKARREWLSLGLYEPIVAGIAQLLDGISANVLDAGCGEGYYTNALAQYCGEICGSDISKEAVLSAARQYSGVEFTVASNRDLPYQDQQFSAVLSLFGFPVEAEFSRVLQPGGRIITVDPTRDHLIELKEALYTEIKAASIPSLANCTLECEIPIEFELQIDHAEMIQKLLAMTPHYYRAPKDKLAMLLDAPPRRVTVSVVGRIWSPTL